MNISTLYHMAGNTVVIPLKKITASNRVIYDDLIMYLKDQYPSSKIVVDCTNLPYYNVDSSGISIFLKIHQNTNHDIVYMMNCHKIIQEKLATVGLTGFFGFIDSLDDIA